MAREVQWNVQRSQKLHLDWFEPDWPVGCMDEKALDEINRHFANIAMLMENMLPELVRPIGSPQAAIMALEYLSGQIDIVAKDITEICKILGNAD